MKTKKQKYDIEKMIADGYCRVSNRHRMVARIDREDWRVVMARDHAPWDPVGQGMDWVRGMGLASAADHYRRCYSQDKVQFEAHEDELFRRFVNSGDPDAPGAFVGGGVKTGKQVLMDAAIADIRKTGMKIYLPVRNKDSEKEYNSAFAEGRVAGEFSAPPENNPYPAGPQNFAWEAGRFEAEQERLLEDEEAREVWDNQKSFFIAMGVFFAVLVVWGVAERLLG